MELYIANLGRNLVELQFRDTFPDQVPGTPNPDRPPLWAPSQAPVCRVRVSPGAQRTVWDGEPSVVALILAQLAPYGLLPIADAMATWQFIGLVYAVDARIDMRAVQAAHAVAHPYRAEDFNNRMFLAANIDFGPGLGIPE